MIQNNRNPNNLPDVSWFNLMEYAYLLWHWAWVILLAGVLAGGAAFFISKSSTPVYESTTRLLISSPPATSSIDSTGMIPGATLTQTYSQMLTDTPVLAKVIEIVGLTEDAETLNKAIAVQVLTGTQIISVTVSDTSPTRAAEIANTIGQVFSDKISQLQQARYASTLTNLNNQVNTINGLINDTTVSLAQANASLAQATDPAQATDLAQKGQLEISLNQYRQSLSNLMNNQSQVQLAAAQTSTNVAQSQPAQIPSIPVSPKTGQNTLLAVIAGMMLAITAVYAIDALDDSIKNPEEIRQKFDLPILGVIAQHTQFEGKPITQEQPRSPVSESFRTLRTNITYAAVDKPLRWIMVTSPTPMDGKTTVCANLGVVFAQGGKKAVILDGDLRRPMESVRFGLENTSGLSELFLRPLDSLDESAQVTGVPGLKVVTSGALPPNPAELMASKKMLEILTLLTAENDLVLVDTPPVLSVTDAAALAPGMDGVILVAKPGMTKMAAFKQTLEQLRGVGAKILGVVLNDVEPKSRKYGYYYHQYYSKGSYYYSEDGTKKKKAQKEPTKEKELKQD